MAMSNYLRAVVTTRLNSIKTLYGIKEISYRIASEDAAFPHLVYDITTITPTDMGREDYLIDINIWTKNEDLGYEILDAVRDLMAFLNDPQTNILPTFYEVSAGQIEDTDRAIVHLVYRMQAQVYERS